MTDDEDLYSFRDDEFDSSENNSAQKESESIQEQDFIGRERIAASTGDRRIVSHLWLVSYSDFMTIMMMFFLGLYGYTTMAKAALMREQRKRHMNYSEFAQMVSKLKDPLGDRLQVQEDIEKIVVQMPDNVLFASGQPALNQNAIRTLDEMGQSLKRVDGDIIVEGHTDNVPIHGGRYRTNMELSAARAFSVIEALTKTGVPPERLAAWGFGEYRPIDSNLNVAGRQKNRRIEIVLLKKSIKK